jgi:hypothetical protein
MQPRAVEVIVDIATDADGRLVGVVRAARGGHGLSFSGSMELLARLEALSGRSSVPAPEPEAPKIVSEPAPLQSGWLDRGD